MPVDINFSIFPLISEAAKNEQSRPGTLMLEYFQAAVTISSLEATVEVPTQLEECLGLLQVSFNSVAGNDPTDQILLLTDGVISSSAVTVNVTCIDISDGAVVIRGFLLGRTKARTVLLDSPV